MCASVGFDTSGFSIPYLAVWQEQGDLQTVERAAACTDAHAKRIEQAIGESPIEEDLRAVEQAARMLRDRFA